LKILNAEYCQNAGNAVYQAYSTHRAVAIQTCVVLPHQREARENPTLRAIHMTKQKFCQSYFRLIQLDITQA
jgi:hypothetical protein